MLRILSSTSRRRPSPPAGRRSPAGARLTGGEAAGRRLLTTSGDGLRPTTAVVRGACFNILGTSVVGAEVVDLFAGVGSMGLEALSRGASKVTFVELRRDRTAMISENLRMLYFEDRGKVVVGDVLSWIPSSVETLRAAAVVLLDPPYRDNGPDLCLAAVAKLGVVAGLLPEWDPVIVVEHHRLLLVPGSSGALDCVRTTRHGTNVLSFFRRWK
jgi:16S rRNA (guanine966-N2)-methyltransferase